MSFETRPRQTEFVNAIRATLAAGTRTVLGQAPTGFGKTVIASYMLGTAAERGTSSLFLVHRRELIKQTIAAFDTVGINAGVIAAGWPEDRQARVQLASVQTYARRRERFASPGLVVWDECHHLAAGTWASIYRGLDRAFHVGLTATPERLDGAGLGDFFEKMVTGPSVKTLIDEGSLSPYRLYAPPGLSVAGVHSRMGDFVKSELAAAADKPTITGDAIREYRRRCDGARALVFCTTIDHSQHVVAQFNASGIPAAHVDGETPIEQRDELIESFRRGDILVLSNVELFGEGFDLPATECVISLRPTQSLALVLQQWGRALRKAPGKEYAVILDHAGNCDRHGLPDDERAWSLDGAAARTQGSGDGGPRVKRCKVCAAAAAPAAKVCRACGNAFALGGGEQIEFVQGELVEVDVSQVRSRRQEQHAADTFDKLVAYARREGYKDPRGWAGHVHAARERKKAERERTARG